MTMLAKPAVEAALTAAETFVDQDEPTGAAEAEDQEEISAGAAIDRQSPDYLLGYEGGIQGIRKGLTAEMKADAARLAHFEAGQADGRAEAAREREEA